MDFVAIVLLTSSLISIRGIRMPAIKPLSVKERDIDLLLLEEFNCSEEFQEWFWAKTVGMVPKLGECCSALHSVASSNGESDLVIEFSSQEQKQWCFLIENKIDALFQPDQPERYNARKQEYIDTGKCSDCKTLIVAPSRYLKRHSQDAQKFDYQLSYEDLQDWFKQNAALGQRGLYKAELLSVAIEYGVYQPEFLPLVTKNWLFFHRLMQEMAPEIQLPELSNRHTGGWKQLTRTRTLPGELYIMYKPNRGFVDLTFPNKGPQASASEFHQFKAHFSPLLTAKMSIEEAYKSAVIRIKVTPTEIERQEFQNQELAIRETIEATKKLNQWVTEHREDIELSSKVA